MKPHSAFELIRSAIFSVTNDRTPYVRKMDPYLILTAGICFYIKKCGFVNRIIIVIFNAKMLNKSEISLTFVVIFCKTNQLF